MNTNPRKYTIQLPHIKGTVTLSDEIIAAVRAFFDAKPEARQFLDDGDLEKLYALWTWEMGSPHQLTSVLLVAGIDVLDSVFSVPELCFAFLDGITSVQIPEGIKDIGSYAFEYCANLKKLAVPDSVTTIGVSAFQDCTSLESIELPGVDHILSDAFAKCAKLKSVKFSDMLESIDSGAFHSCTSLHRVDFPDTLERINKEAFAYCPLYSVFIPENVDYIGSRAFIGSICKLDVACAADEKPSGWEDDWVVGTYEVVWDCE